MQFRDISQEMDTLYTLANGQVVFFMLDREGEITFELNSPGTEAHVFALFIESEKAKDLSVTQKHHAPDTRSRALVRSVLTGTGESHYQGMIRIKKEALRSDASQESRALLLSPRAKHTTQPSLEILSKDVICHHKASAAPLNRDALYYLESRGLSPKESKTLLLNGFLAASFEEMEELGVPTETVTQLKETVSRKLSTLYA